MGIQVKSGNMYTKKLLAEAMSEWQNMQEKPNTNLRGLLKSKRAKTFKPVAFQSRNNKASKTRRYCGEVEAWRAGAKSSASYLAD